MKPSDWIAIGLILLGLVLPRIGGQAEPAVITGPCWITLVEESGDRTAALAAIYQGREFQDALRAGSHHFRMLDPDVVDGQGRVPDGAAGYITRAKAKGLPYWFGTDASGTVQWEGPAPKSLPEALKQLQQGGTR